MTTILTVGASDLDMPEFKNPRTPFVATVQQMLAALQAPKPAEAPKRWPTTFKPVDVKDLTVADMLVTPLTDAALVRAFRLYLRLSSIQRKQVQALVLGADVDSVLAAVDAADAESSAVFLNPAKLATNLALVVAAVENIETDVWTKKVSS
jgi:hypothetical protein